MTPIRVVMFDFDGTLIDTMGAFADLAGRLMANYYGDSFEKGREAYLATSGVPFFQQLELLYPGDPRNKGVSTRFEADKQKAYATRGLFPDVRPTVDWLRSHGVRCVVSSNNFTDVVRRVLLTQPVKFDLVLGFEDGLAKGEKHVAYVERVLSIPRSHMLFVGDSLRDAEFAQAAGVRFVGKLGTVSELSFTRRFGPERFPLIRSLIELIPLLESKVLDRFRRAAEGDE